MSLPAARKKSKSRAPVARQTGKTASTHGKSSDAASHLSRYLDPARYTPGFAWQRTEQGEELACEGVTLADIASRAGTPAYVYSSASMTAAYQGLDRAIGRLPHTLCYAVKANSNLSILRHLARLGSGFDIVSGGELYRLERAGVSPDRVVFSGAGKSREEIRQALTLGILLFNVESEAELDLLASEASRLGRPAPAAMRVNPDVAAGGHPHISTGHHQHKFGVDWADARRLYFHHRESRWIDWQGISAHLGSQILTLAPFERALKRLAGHVRELSSAGIKLRYLDFGGGLGVRYSNEQPPSHRDYARTLAAIVRPLGCHLLLEPGRAIIASAGVLLTRVLYTKQNRGKTFVIVDAAMNDFIRPALYGAVHPMTPVKRVASARRAAAASHVRRVDVVGPVCETGDCFLQNWPLGEIAAGDFLVLWGAGAYGFAQASNYNSRPRPAEVLVDGTQAHLIRRRESISDLVRGE